MYVCMYFPLLTGRIVLSNKKNLKKYSIVFLSIFKKMLFGGPCTIHLQEFFPILETLLTRAFWCRYQLLFWLFYYLYHNKTLFWTLSLWWLGFAFNIITIRPRFVTRYNLFEHIVQCCQYLLSEVHATLFFLNI